MERLANVYNTGLAALAVWAQRTSAYAKRSYRTYRVTITRLDGKFRESIHWLLAPLGQAARWGFHRANAASGQSREGSYGRGATSGVPSWSVGGKSEGMAAPVACICSAMRRKALLGTIA